MASHHSIEILAYQCLWLYSWQPTGSPTPEGWMKMWILYTMAFSAFWKTGYYLQNVVATGDNHVKWIQPISEREIAPFLSSVGPRFYTYIKSYMYLWPEVNGKLGNRKVKSRQEEGLGYGPNTFKFILYLHVNGLIYNHNKIYDFMSRYEKHIQFNICIFIYVCMLYPIALDSNSHIVSFIHC